MNKKTSKNKSSGRQLRKSSAAAKKNSETITQISDSEKSKKEKKNNSNNNKKNTSLRLDKQTLKALKIRAIEQETSIQNLIESLILTYLKKKIKLLDA